MTNLIQEETAAIIKKLYSKGDLKKGILASVRHAPTVDSPQAQALWPLLMRYLTPDMLSSDGQPTAQEVAVYTAVRLYAVHQQSTESFVFGAVKPKNDEQPGEPLFRVLAQLRGSEDTRVALDRRVQPLLATTNVASVINALTHLVSILKATKPSLKIDYAQLAQDLYWFQQNYKQANRIRLQWGEAYYRSTKSTKTTEGKKNK
ncbi:type I-E CRISPR-associated protein Cse2/CasB [Lactiplantibacillus pentosus]|uniref:type I-E CRISPR-associated protein Cse2/CasB n=1 Tax=Lactiplantibacillus pentosus TaxID=1589 RepID=UPI00132F86F7|nr:type I-E CRISPR-associated protein Cse2/CasB [Lactiplantibacillus pentosus]MBQ0837855.1 type I-E CRISPR-associated protein Cse2/CasB [Lactiplantibacillus pentosus]